MPRARHVESAGATSRRAVFAGGAGVAAVILAASARRSQAQDGTPAASAASLPAFPPNEQLALDQIVAEQLGGQQVPGAVAGVAIPGRGAWRSAQGIADLRNAAPITIDDHFRIASVTKTFAATLVLQLVDAGRLRLHDTLES
jgi:D-alanyl-D-alanine carboxypeptidase